MTNRIFKDYYKNKPILDAAADTVNVMCIILVTANKLFPKIMYPKAVCRFLDERTEYCKIANEYESLGVFDYKVDQACESAGIVTEDCSKIVEKYMHPPTQAIKKVYIGNVRMMFLQLHREHGLGCDRRMRLVETLLSDRAETERALQRVKEMGGAIDIEDISSVDYKKFMPKKENVSYREQKQAAQAMQWLRDYRDSVINGGK